MAFSDLALTTFTDPFWLSILPGSNTIYELSAEVTGTNADVALTVVYNNPTLNLYQSVWSDSNYNDSGRQSGTFTASLINFRFGQTAVLDHGPASFTNPTLMGQSNPVSAVEGTYKVATAVHGEVVVTAVAYDANDDPIGQPIEIWSDPCSPTCSINQQFTTPPETNSLRLHLVGHIAEGQMGVSGTTLSYHNLGSTTQRSSYTLAGQAIALRVSDRTNDNLYFIHSDHLGSASVMSDETGAVVPDSQARYLPFGDWRGTPPATNPTVTDRGFTGHKHNDDLGLIYMNARYYVSGIGRFASADTLVSDPTNPQSLNRYSYVGNRPLNMIDPSGHCEIESYTSGGTCTPPPMPTQPQNGDSRDLTPWIVEELNFLPTIPESQTFATSFETSPGALSPNCMLCAYYYFYQLVADGAPLDVKDKILQEVGKVIKLGDSWFEYSTAGNILFGYYGAAWGFSSAELHSGAAVAQLQDFIRNPNTPLGPRIDTTDDYYGIELGIILYNEGFAPDGTITSEEFVDILSTYEHANSLAVMEPHVRALSIQNPNWPYSQGYFYNDANPPNPASFFPTFRSD